MKILILSLALLACALYFLTRDRKIEFELEIEPRDTAKNED